LICTKRELASRRKDVRYLRFMDDLLILTQTRWQLKRAVAEMNQWFERAGLEQHPNKTFIGRIEKVFDWLGYAFNERGRVQPAPKTIQKFKLNLHRLYEQARKQKLSLEQCHKRVMDYIKRWQQWADAGVDDHGRLALDGPVTPIPVRIEYLWA
jgi:hypothetical protein